MRIPLPHLFPVPEHATTTKNGLLMIIDLAPITKENWEQAAQLDVADEQIEFVDPNVMAIAAMQFYPWIRPRAIYDGSTMVGFLTYGQDPDDGIWWLYRFMIDRRYQGNGRGREALKRLLQDIEACGEVPALRVAYHPENAAAARLYATSGFVASGPAPWGEDTATYTFATT
jgi:diamine N-acetyltransferase